MASARMTSSSTSSTRTAVVSPGRKGAAVHAQAALRNRGGEAWVGDVSPNRALRVIQWATGGVGRAAIEGIVAHPDLELVGVWVHAEDKVGQDAGTLAGIDPLGVAATDDVDAL